MGIWIRSRDKEMIMNCNSLEIDLEDGKSIYSNGYVLGTYSTKEKALKVLDDIENYLARGYDFYKMPQDDEVLGE